MVKKINNPKIIRKRVKKHLICINTHKKSQESDDYVTCNQDNV